MPSIAQTVDTVVNAPTLDARVAEIRKVPGQHGVDSHQEIYSQIAKTAYVPDMGADFAYVHQPDFFSLAHFQRSYAFASVATQDFSKVDRGTLSALLQQEPKALLALRTITGLTKEEFAHCTKMIDKKYGGEGISGGVVDGHERRGTKMRQGRADLIAETLNALMNHMLFGPPPSPGVVVKQEYKPDSTDGWADAARFASGGVPYSMFLHQRHYGGAFRQLLDGTSNERGLLLEDAVETLFTNARVPYIKTGSHNQSAIFQRFGLNVAPSPDFAIFNAATDTLMAILECKGANDGGTARDKAGRFVGLRAEANRLGGIPVFAVLGGLGWKRTRDALGPVIRDCDGRVFTLANLDDMLNIAPLAGLVGTAP